MAKITHLGNNSLTYIFTLVKQYVTSVANTKVDKVTGKGLSTNDLTDILKGNYDAAYNHSQLPHAPANAQENIIETINVNGVALSPVTKAVSITVPTKTSELTNDSNYLSAVPGEYVTNAELTAKGYQTAAQVDTAIQKVVAAAPTALDTLNEIAAALNNDANFAGTMTTELSKKANTADFAELTNQEIDTIWNSVTV